MMRRALLVLAVMLFVAGIVQAGYYVRESGKWKYTGQYIPGARPEKVFRAMLDSSVPAIEADKVWNITYDGKNITGIGSVVCVVDTGINFSSTGLVNQNATNFSVDCTSGSCLEVSSMDTDVEGHGTNVAGIIASNDTTYRGVAPGSKLISVKVLNSTGAGLEQWVSNGINWCINHSQEYNITIVSLSLGDNSTFYSSYCDNADAVVESANNASDSGMIVVAASGNDGNKTGIISPSCGSKVISVGAYNESSGKVADFSNYAPILDVVAPGVDVRTYVGTSLWSYSGTSQAAPHVSGTIALMLQAGSLNWSQADNVLKSTATNISDPYMGAGLINAYDAVNTVIGGFTFSNTTHIVDENTTNRLVVNVTNMGIGGTVNLTLSNLTNSFGELLNATLDNGTSTGKSVNLFIPQNSTAPLTIVVNSTATPGAYSGTLVANYSYAENSTSIEINVGAYAENGREIPVNLTTQADFYLRLPQGLKNMTINSTGQISGVNMSVSGKSVLYNGSSSDMTGNQTDDSMVHVVFYNSSQTYNSTFNFTVVFSRFAISSEQVNTTRPWVLLNLTFLPVSETKNLSISGTTLENSTNATQANTPALYESDVSYFNVTIAPNQTWSYWVYVPKNQSGSNVYINISRAGNETTYAGFCLNPDIQNEFLNFNEDYHVSGCSYGSREKLEISNNGTENETYNVTIKFIKPDDTRIGDFYNNSRIVLRYNVTASGNGTQFSAGFVAQDNATGRTAEYSVPVNFFPMFEYNGEGGNVTAVHYFNFGRNTSFRINISNSGPKDLVLLDHSGKCFLNSTNLTHGNYTINFTGISVSNCTIKADSSEIVEANMTYINQTGVYTGWIYLNSNWAMPENYLNITLSVNVTGNLNVTYNGTYYANQSSNLSINTTARYMDGGVVSGLNNSNVTSALLVGPYSESVNVTSYNYSSDAGVFNLTIPEIPGGNWTLRYSVKDWFNNSGSSEIPVSVNGSNLKISLSKSADNIDSGTYVTFRLNITNEGNSDDYVNVSFSGCSSQTNHDVLVKAGFYNDSLYVKPKVSSTCTETATVSNGTFWNGTSVVSSSSVSSKVTVKTTTTTSTTTTAQTTVPPTTTVPENTTQNSTENQTSNASCVYNFTVVYYPQEISVNGNSSVNISVKNSGTCSQNITAEILSDYFSPVRNSMEVPAGKYGIFTLSMSRCNLSVGKYAGVLRISGQGKIRSYSIIILIQPDESEKQQIVSEYHTLKKLAGTSEDAVPIISKIENEIQKGNYAEVKFLLSQLNSTIKSANLTGNSVKKTKSGWIIFVVIGLLFVLLFAFSRVRPPRKEVWQPSQKSYTFKKSWVQKLKDRLTGKG